MVSSHVDAVARTHLRRSYFCSRQAYRMGSRNVIYWFVRTKGTSGIFPWQMGMQETGILCPFTGGRSNHFDSVKPNTSLWDPSLDFRFGRIGIQFEYKLALEMTIDEGECSTVLCHTAFESIIKAILVSLQCHRTELCALLFPNRWEVYFLLGQPHTLPSPLP